MSVRFPPNRGLAGKDHAPTRQTVSLSRDYREASQNLLKLEDLTDAEIAVVQDMVGQISAMVRSEGNIEP